MKQKQNSVKTNDEDEVYLKHLSTATVSQIMDDSRFGIGLFEAFYKWTLRYCIKILIQKDYLKEEIEDSFQDVITKTYVKQKRGALEINGIYCLRSYVYTGVKNSLINKEEKRKVPTVKYLDVKHQIEDNVYENLEEICIQIDKIVQQCNLLSDETMEFWNEYKNHPNEVDFLMKKLNIKSKDTYYTRKHRLRRKLRHIPFAKLLF